jgi:hypothetical protein
LRDTASHDRPQTPAAGIETVWVNGRLALHHGEITDRHAGLRLQPAGSLAAVA